MEQLYTEKRNGFNIVISSDEWAEDPAEWGNFTVKQWREVDGIDEDEHKVLPELQAKLDDGRAFWIDKYEHGGVSYTLAGEGMNDRWDTSSHWGIIELSDEYVKGVEKYEREIYARGDLEEYTQWANGGVMSVYIYELNADGEDDEMIDGSGGIYGTLDDAIKQAQDTVDRLTPPRGAALAKRASALHI